MPTFTVPIPPGTTLSEEPTSRLFDTIKTPRNGASGNGELPQRCAGYLDKGADIHARDDKGRTPLIWAALNYRRPIMALLLERGADVLACDSDGMNALAHARKAKAKPAIPLLEAAMAEALKKEMSVELKAPAKVFRHPLHLRRGP